MRAADIRHPLPTVHRETLARDAAQTIADARIAGLVVVDDRGEPVATISSIDVLRLLLPDYIQQDPSLARVWDDAGSEEVWAEAAARTIGDLLDDDRAPVNELLRVDADATLVEVASELVEHRVTVALVRGGEADRPLFVTLPAVMERILGLAADAGTDTDGTPQP